LIVVDATHLKSFYKGMLMAAVTKDLNDRMVILAYAIVPTEDIESWRWFFS
jgi:hypothetical protein